MGTHYLAKTPSFSALCRGALLIGCCSLVLTGCFGSAPSERSYYVLHGVSIAARDSAPMNGLLRVRNLNAASIYEKFQIVVRKNPYELNYSESNVWAVKPNRMVSDVIAAALAHSGQFASVARELGERRPDFLLSGELGAIEVYDSGDLWYAHLAITLSLSVFSTGETLQTFTFDQRKDVPSRTFSQAARALSELLSTAMDEFIVRVARYQESTGAPAVKGRGIGRHRQVEMADVPDPVPSEPEDAAAPVILIREADPES